MTSSSEEARPPFPPFNEEAAMQKVRMAEDAWNSRDPARVSLGRRPDAHPSLSDLGL